MILAKLGFSQLEWFTEGQVIAWSKAGFSRMASFPSDCSLAASWGKVKTRPHISHRPEV